jgi:RNA polymerase sigma-70 factor, ECF subfamily
VDSHEAFARLRGGSEEAFDAIFRAWYAPLVRFTGEIVASRAVAEEIVQDVMLELWRRREVLDPDSSPKAYLFQSARNRALNHLRHERVERRGEPQVVAGTRSVPSPHVELVEDEIDVALRDAVGSLPERCREVFELSRVHGLKYGEIAATLGISIKTVEAQMGKALRVLRERMARWLPAGDRY